MPGSFLFVGFVKSQRLFTRCIDGNHKKTRVIIPISQYDPFCQDHSKAHLTISDFGYVAYTCCNRISTYPFTFTEQISMSIIIEPFRIWSAEPIPSYGVHPLPAWV
jgi:hypothetical protein